MTRVADELARAYVFEEVGARMAATIRKNLADGKYDSHDRVRSLTRHLTDDLQAICHDKHLRVRMKTARRRGPSLSPDGGPRNVANNYGFKKVEVMDGNVGYIKLDGFSGTPDAEPTAAGAMAFVANADALIIDLRENGGGSPSMIAFLSGYLFDERTHLNSFDDRIEGVSETWSRTDMPGRRFGQSRPVYVLTSADTFSGAEEFTYNLKHLKRATIVGETTGGGAHPVRGYVVNRYVEMSVPFARAVNPVTGTNWEGVGVVPHVKVAAGEALGTALDLAMPAAVPTDSGGTR